VINYYDTRNLFIYFWEGIYDHQGWTIVNMNRREKKSKEARGQIYYDATNIFIYFWKGRNEINRKNQSNMMIFKKMRDLNKIKKDSNAIIENNLYSSKLCNACHKMNTTTQIMSETTWAINISPYWQVELSIIDEISKEPWGKLNWSRRSFKMNRIALGSSLCLNLSDHFYF
jgi:hypothetical protein